MQLEFTAVAIWWRGPAPFVFVPIPADLSSEIKAISSRVSYGWGVIPVSVRIGHTQYTTSLFPKDGVYLVPIKVAVQRAEEVNVGNLVDLQVEILADRVWGSPRTHHSDATENSNELKSDRFPRCSWGQMITI